MATSNLGDNIGNIFLSAYLQKQKLRQDQSQFEEEMRLRQVEGGLLNKFRNRSLELDQQGLDLRRTESDRGYEINKQEIGLRQLSSDRDYELGKGGLLARNRELGLGQSRLKEDARQFDKTMEYKDKELQSDSLLGYAKINSEKYKNFDKTKGALENYLSLLKKNESDSLGDDYTKVKAEASGQMAEALKIVGIDYNGDLLNEIRSVADEDDSVEDKRKLYNAAIAEMFKNGKIDKEQASILNYWKEIGTR